MAFPYHALNTLYIIRLTICIYTCDNPVPAMSLKHICIFTNIVKSAMCVTHVYVPVDL